MRQLPTSSSIDRPAHASPAPSPHTISLALAHIARSRPAPDAVFLTPYLDGRLVEDLHSLGLPVVATPVAVEGMHAIDGTHVLLGESPEELAAAVLTAYYNASACDASRAAAPSSSPRASPPRVRRPASSKSSPICVTRTRSSG